MLIKYNIILYIKFLSIFLGNIYNLHIYYFIFSYNFELIIFIKYNYKQFYYFIYYQSEYLITVLFISLLIIYLVKLMI